MVGVRGFEPPTSASQTLRAKPTALHPVRQRVYQEDKSRSTVTSRQRKTLLGTGGSFVVSYYRAGVSYFIPASERPSFGQGEDRNG